ncbi:hypothetical protein M422DRAFT_161356 [Sphaerobolus stellatus SS14]|nr:hypothetical protein M422DRAFT_161356 [Sphaerobolus stellatus SS14]
MSSKEFELRFATDSSSEGKYKLLELPQELCKVIESGLETQLTIRGRPNDDAVLCTSSKTYNIRAVTISNTIIVATSPEQDDPGNNGKSPNEQLVVRDQISHLLELVPVVPRLQRLEAMLKGCEYDEGHERDENGSDEDMDGDEELVARKRAKFTKEDARAEIQASDGELAQAFKDLRILEIDGHLRPITTSYLTHILETLLNSLISQSLPLPPQTIPKNTLLSHLDLEHEIPRKVTEQILSWFGEIKEEEWEMDVESAVRQIGLGRLTLHNNDPVKIQEFLDGWKRAVGDAFSYSVDLRSLDGYYLLFPAPPIPSTHIVYFPVSTLSTSTHLLFADLFLTRPKWRADDIAPFLGGVALNKQEREKLLMKHARAITDPNGVVWYTGRATYV